MTRILHFPTKAQRERDAETKRQLLAEPMAALIAGMARRERAWNEANDMVVDPGPEDA